MAITELDEHLFEAEQFSPGLGTYTLTDDEGTAIIRDALEAGYCHVDTARLYGNEAEVGDALEAAAVDRENVLVATKVAHFEEPEKTPEYVRTAVEESHERLGTETLDLLYHHWPRDGSDVETVLPVLEELVEEGSVANVAVSNYPIRYLERIDDLIGLSVIANQVEMHPLLQQEELHEYVREHGMYLVAYSPIAQGEVFDVPELVEIAEKHDTTPAAVSIAWLLGKEGVVPIPRSSSREHIEANLAARDVELDTEDVKRIESIDREKRLEDPDWMQW
ncbi:aldo/keto reductase [Halalkalicoccus ordinarius]|uniref:aldo/keto reductase n=1 Tax=Halalkalicoccus ordinarius TaxID=3116651 RepID=UPI00300EFE07